MEIFQVKEKVPEKCENLYEISETNTIHTNFRLSKIFYIGKYERKSIKFFIHSSFDTK